MKQSRRNILKSAALVLAAPALSVNAAESTNVGVKSGMAKIEFRHGVASGDPSEDGFVIWTRVTRTIRNVRQIDVTFEVSASPDFDKLVDQGVVRTSHARDFTVKHTASNLQSGAAYYYRFRVGEVISPTGQSRTLPKGEVESARFAVVSCSNYAFGHFNVYDAIAKRGDIDAVIHLGDYLYEYGVTGYGGKTSKALGRQHKPAHEILSLTDYRLRHAQYKSDPGSQAVHAAHPFITIWDDHETANNSWENGAENHDLSEGTWNARRQAALRAYYEWMPVRDPAPGQAPEAYYRTYEWGNLLTLAALETRLMARTEQLDYGKIGKVLATPEGLTQFKTVDLVDPKRELLGAPQSKALKTALASSVASGKPWRVLANQMIMAEIIAPNLAPLKDTPSIKALAKQIPSIKDFIALTALDVPLNLDAWDGYPAARERFYADMTDIGARDLIVLTGDTHEWWANELSTKGGEKMGVELGTSGVTSPGASQYFGEETSTYSRLINERNVMVHHHSPHGHGYIDLSLSPDTAHAEFITVTTVRNTAYETATSAKFNLKRQGNSLKLETLE